MLTKSQKEKIIQFAEKQVAKNDPFHQIDHILKTVEIAVRLAKIENGDRNVCWTSAMLHDICKSKRGDHGAEGSKLAEKFLLELNLDKSFVERVRDAIYFHNKGFKGGSIERQILYDADKLQVIGVKNFKNRLLSNYFWAYGKKASVKLAINEYYVFAASLHTKTGQNEAKKHAEEVKEFFGNLEKSSD